MQKANSIRFRKFTIIALYGAMALVALRLVSKPSTNLLQGVLSPLPTLTLGNSPDSTNDEPGDVAKFFVIDVTANGVDLVLHRPPSVATDAETVTLVGSTNLVTATWEPFLDATFPAGDTNLAVTVSTAMLDAHAVVNSCFFAFINSGDSDGDGLADWDERFNLKTDPCSADTDFDGMPDGWELAYGLDPLDYYDRVGDPDHDRLTNIEEYLHGSSPRCSDSDGDGVSDADEVHEGLDPANPDTDGDGLDDGYEPTIGLSPKYADTDHDGMPDGWEVQHMLNARNADDASNDQDSDGITNLREYELGTDPRSSDTDGDGLSDIDEAGGFWCPTFSGDWASSASGWTPVTITHGEGGVRFAFSESLTISGETAVDVLCRTNGVLCLDTTAHSRWYGWSTDVPLPLSGNDSAVTASALVVAPFWIAWHSGLTASVSVFRRTSTVGDVIEYAVRHDGLTISSASTATISCQTVFRFEGGRLRRVEMVYAGDGLSTSAESHAVIGLRDNVLGVVHQLGCFATVGLNPARAYRYVPALGTDPTQADTDGDGIDDGVEIANGTDSGRADTDGDGIPDGWELDHGLDPLDPDDAVLDPDCDGLNNLEEYLNDTNPSGDDADDDGVPDGYDTDGDGVDDRTEVQNGSDPNDPMDLGLPPTETELRGLDFSIGGDYAAWEMTIEGQGPYDYRTMRITMGGPSASGQNKTKHLHKGNTYRLTMRWLNCDGHDYDPRAPWYCWRAQIDGLPGEQTFDNHSSVRNPGVAEVVFGSGWIAENASGLLTAHVHESALNFDGSSGGGNVAEGAEVTLHVLADPKLAPDFNRDGEISDGEMTAANRGTAFRFWINDDEDRLSTEGRYSESPRTNIPGARDGWLEIDGRDPDCADAHVNGICDLLDFAPVLADASEVAGELPEAIRARLSFRLRQEDGAFNTVWSNLGRSAANSFQRTGMASGFGPALGSAPERAETRRISAEGLPLPPVFAARAASGCGVFLVEGRAESEKPLWLEVLVDEMVVCSNRLVVSVSSVESMYRLFSLRGAAENPSMEVEVPDTPENQPEGIKDLDVFFLHGFNVNAEDARAWGAEVFKRLWQSGSNARFHMLPWRGDYRLAEGFDITTTLSALHYPHNAWFALRTSGGLKRYIEAAQPDVAKRVLMTQSLGNMVACEALRSGLQVGKYFMFNAAVAGEAINSALQNVDAVTRMKYVPSDWQAYDSRSWSAYWYTWFVGDSNDARGKLGWPGRFSSALGNAGVVYNYYSSGDEVFAETPIPPWLFQGMSYSGANYCWQKQETLKGSALPAGTLHGGWGFHTWKMTELVVRPGGISEYQENTYCYSPSDATAMILDESIKTTPVFERGFSPMFSPNASEDDQRLALAKHIPAISSPVGGNAVLRSERMNFDLNGSDYRNGWGRNHAAFGNNWFHSDMKDMAYYYVYPLYDELVGAEKGNLK